MRPSHNPSNPSQAASSGVRAASLISVLGGLLLLWGAWVTPSDVVSTLRFARLWQLVVGSQWVFAGVGAVWLAIGIGSMRSPSASRFRTLGLILNTLVQPGLNMLPV